MEVTFLTDSLNMSKGKMEMSRWKKVFRETLTLGIASVRTGCLISTWRVQDLRVLAGIEPDIRHNGCTKWRKYIYFLAKALRK